MTLYAIFAGDQFYAAGGWYDFRGTYTDKESLKKKYKKLIKKFHWVHIVNMKTMKIVHEKGNGGQR